MAVTSQNTLTLRGQLIRFEGNPFETEDALRYERDGLVHAVDGKIVLVGDAQALLAEHPELQPTAVSGILAPGFVDAHLHYPQMRILGAYGEQLLDWLNRYTFPAELSFADPAVCQEAAQLFVRSCISQGVTTAAAWSTVHPQSVEALFQAASHGGMRMITGKVLMDRNAPEGLQDTAQSGFDDSQALIQRWHGVGRNAYAVTPRFAPTSTPEQLEAAGALMAQDPSLYLQSHVAETQAECAWVAELYPGLGSYLSVYAHYGLMGRRALYGHGIYLEPGDVDLLAETETGVVHCPSSNLFLGSGLFPLHQVRPSVRVGLGSDIGAGTHLSPLVTMGDAYKVAQLQGQSLNAAQLWWLATAGGAELLDLSSTVGNLAPGMDADIVLLDPEISELHRYRVSHAKDFEELLFFMATCGESRMVKQTWVAGSEAAPAAR